MKKRIMRTILTMAAAAVLSAFTLGAQAASDRWQSTTARNTDNDIQIDFKEVQVTLPQSWSGKCQMGVSENSVTFYQTKSRKLWEQEGYTSGGRLFSIGFSSDGSYKDDPSYMTIGSTSEGTYYASFPTDVQAYTKDTQAYEEFSSMANDMEWIKSRFVLTAEQSSNTGASGEYIFPQSATEYLSKDDLSDMNADQIQMAINEIYARHHRKFILPSVQEYFNSKSWYSGTIEAEDFDVSVMNAYESANIGLMVERLNAKGSSGENITILPSATKDAYGMIIESGDGYFRIRIEDGSSIQFWYDEAKLDDMGVSKDSFKVGAVTSIVYDTESYEAVNILIW